VSCHRPCLVRARHRARARAYFAHARWRVLPALRRVSLDANKILFGRTVRGILGGDSIPDMFIPKLVELYVSGRLPIDRC
jgi:Zn-dependent alcohol dehydrogenase